jgi:signal transduction histidine kinase
LDISLVYFIYGLAFFSMGLALILEIGRSPLIGDSRLFIPLALFGFIHGFHEWFEMFSIRNDWSVFNDSGFASWTRILLLSVSFSSLIFFGLSILRPDFEVKNKNVNIWIAGLFIYGMVVILFASLFFYQHPDALIHIDVIVRYFIGTLGAVLAGLALFKRARIEKHENRVSISASLKVAGVGFVVYALTQTVGPKTDSFPGLVWNTSSFLNLFGIPVQVIRAGLAVMITAGVLRSIQFSEKQRSKNLLDAQTARLEAVERIHQELVNREAMRQELLRHIVIAQEEERSRISRELHDETAQVITAFSLSLATLRNKISGNQEIEIIVDDMLRLSQRISAGIYRLVRDLRPVQLDELGLAASLQYLVDEARDLSGIRIDIQISGVQRKLDPIIETVLFRVSQEAINNIGKHSETKEAKLELEYCPEKIIVSIQDHGVGFNFLDTIAGPRGWGIAGMRERIESVRGSFELTTAPGMGTRIVATVPLIYVDG